MAKETFRAWVKNVLGFDEIGVQFTLELDENLLETERLETIRQKAEFLASRLRGHLFRIEKKIKDGEWDTISAEVEG